MDAISIRSKKITVLRSQTRRAGALESGVGDESEGERWGEREREREREREKETNYVYDDDDQILYK